MNNKNMKILHTSDWHLGQNFKNRSREQEHEKFLAWLIETIESKKIDILIVAGDIFDTANPPKYALTMYHDFLVKVIKTACSDVIIVAGNHDSVATLEVTKNFAKSLNIHIVATGEDIDETIVSIKKDDQLKAIVCAVPYLRDNIIRDANKSKNNKELENEYKEGMKQYYKNIYNKAKDISSNVPIIATGHFTTTGATVNPDSEREIYIGKLSDVDSEVLTSFDYVAMGHLHKSQQVGKHNHIRYSGSPIPLSFSEYNQTKSVIVVEFKDKNIENIEIIDIPLFKGIYRITGTIQEIKDELENINDKENKPFLDVVATNETLLDVDLKEFLNNTYDDGVDIISIQKEKKIEDRVLTDVEQDTKLEELDYLSVFEKRLEAEDSLVDNSDLKNKLINEYKVIVQELENEDK
ncbi:MAG: exonuclease subunit SbcD [Campylobacterota bacterium]|nr:exonuclease subunit SbcD [Campylobacterota bacterium]